ncbi:hypothetical protein CO058_00955 [candidate division WWE3 bacterium CG_4_9_14_0_2_um_filter_35_11]|uniref:Undecaprenyldiphospho-muramoylpentapeptide beta-N-acetylglucosaminyltransferase n=1 Tax=candidate division WWE3 bacterium CG_4_9_14_0_2_um_filter_35_11 TaxID=1975077 RepID=A0A2M8EMD6_UNCKA|nr:MAG: hypothetical protein COV25_03200 [candidate division WWE3 bacterium CG10_big_fil_rev_8_21_14_0_10_35_32]PJC23888.1 MAG: hypothetical protein CO058_00955 [candidate division WWE3 bacterium CG_4_9_14_0_2_um_filter_35_11]
MRHKLLFTGGHHNSALAVINWLIAKDKDIKIEWVGDQYPSKGITYPEYKEVSELKIPYHKITAGKLFRFTNPFYIPRAIVSFFKIPLGFFQAFFILIFVKPDLIISFGGFIAVPIVVVGKLLGIKSVTHEQTVVIGFANRIIGKFVDKIYVSWPIDFYDADDSLKNKMVYTGLPIDLGLFKNAKKINFNNKLKTIYVTGGKKGSFILNEAILSNLEFFASNFNVIWSCGNTKGDFDFERIQSEIQKLDESLKVRISVKEYFFKEEVANVFNSCDFVISRSGAHTVYELAILKKPCILVPIPWSSNDEQRRNAKLLVRVGLGEIVEEDELLRNDFKSIVLEFSDTLEKRAQGLHADSLDVIVTQSGQDNLGNEIIKILQK